MDDRPTRAQDAVNRLGLISGSTAGEFGDVDGDEGFRAAVEAAIGSELASGDDDDVFDLLFVWWRDGDGDLTDELVDAASAIAPDGIVYLLVPRAGRDGFVPAADIDDAAETAGLPKPTTGPTLNDWSIVKLSRTRGSGKVRR